MMNDELGMMNERLSVKDSLSHLKPQEVSEAPQCL